MEFKDITKKHQIIFSKEVNYDTRKNLNLSEKVIPQAIIKEIEEEGVTIERIDTLGVPVLKYKTQITLHGIFDETIYKRAGYGQYKNLVVNQNKSLGVRYNGIDGEKKDVISKALSLLDDSGEKAKYRFTADSRGVMIIKDYIVKTKEEYIERLNECKLELKMIPDIFIGQKSVAAYRGMFNVIVRVEIDFNAILEKNLFKFISFLTNMSVKSREDLQVLLKEQKRKESLIREENQRIRDIGYAKTEKQEKDLLENFLKENPCPFPEIASLPKYNNGDKFIIAKVNVNNSTVSLNVTYLIVNKALNFKKCTTIIRSPFEGNPFQSILLDFPDDYKFDLSKNKLYFDNTFLIYDSTKQVKPNTQSVVANKPATTTRQDLSTKQETKQVQSSSNKLTSTEGTTITRNLGQNGIEIKFKVKQEKAIYEYLKQKKFRWSPNQSLWYAKYSEQLLKEVNEMLLGESPKAAVIEISQKPVVEFVNRANPNRKVARFTPDEAQAWEDWRIRHLKIGERLQCDVLDEYGRSYKSMCRVESFLVDNNDESDGVSVYAFGSIDDSTHAFKRDFNERELLKNSNSGLRIVVIPVSQLYKIDAKLPLMISHPLDNKGLVVSNKFISLYNTMKNQLYQILK